MAVADFDVTAELLTRYKLRYAHEIQVAADYLAAVRFICRPEHYLVIFGAYFFDIRRTAERYAEPFSLPYRVVYYTFVSA